MASLSPSIAASTGTAPRDLANAIVRGNGVQANLPSEVAATARPATRSNSSGTKLMLDAWEVLAIVALLLGALFVIMQISEKAVWQRPSEHAKSSSEHGPAAPNPRGLARNMQDEAETLASTGQHTEAIHRLLAATMVLLGMLERSEIKSAMTSRELVRILGARAPIQRAVHEIVTSVERTWFAVRPASAADYDAVRANYEIVAAAALGTSI